MLCAAGKCGRKATHLAGQTCGSPHHIFDVTLSRSKPGSLLPWRPDSRGCWFSSWVHIRCLGNGHYRFRSYSGSLCKSGRYLSNGYVLAPTTQQPGHIVDMAPSRRTWAASKISGVKTKF
ncbi:hypothetical protein C4K01_4365 [Pseudomonas synxantha]|nr:hypothetical protein C4K01_4365 [Pseudomonas synxantha]